MKLDPRKSTMILAATFLSILQFAVSRDPMENPNLFEGDMVLTADQEAEINGGSSHQFAAFKTRPWPMPVYYEIDPGLSKYPTAVKAIKAAIKHYEEKTCLRFEEKVGENETLYFYKGKGCWSYVGYIPNKMGPISLGIGCWRQGIVVHEMAHALGFFHEQSRPDRDDYVTILWDNIPKYFQNQFKKYTLKHIDSLNVPYDYLSVMHYHRYQFGGDKPTIDAKDPNYKYKLGQRNGLSEKDILQFGILYNCPGFTKPPLTSSPTQQPKMTKSSTTRVKTTPTSTLKRTTETGRKTKQKTKSTVKTVTAAPMTQSTPQVTTPSVSYRKLLVCENRTRSFSCPNDSEVRVEYAMYGRQIGMYCRWGKVRSTNCKVPDALARIKILCEGKQYCKMEATNTFFGYDPCPGTFKYLEVRMGCLEKN